MVNHLCRELSDQFDLIISFMGSKHCNPELGSYLEGQGYGDFLFHMWDNDFMERLETQQMELMEAGRKRRVLILVDDITMDFADREKLAHLCCRGRHFYVSVAMLSVSYSSFHKSCRRSADFIFLFSMGCQSDRDLMATEFAHSQLHVLRRPDHGQGPHLRGAQPQPEGAEGVLVQGTAADRDYTG